MRGKDTPKAFGAKDPVIRSIALIHPSTDQPKSLSWQSATMSNHILPGFSINRKS
jgi:hypothetical protein